jgi:alpha-ketoglutarate-dependent taurine dioxygenase
MRDAQRHAEVPRLAARQLEALDAIERLSNDPEFHVEMTFEPGDIQLLSNAWILHAREAYEEDAELDSPRHLLRLWLMAHDFAGADDLLRGGIPVQQ